MNDADNTKRIIAMMTDEKPAKFFTKPGCLNCESAICDECNASIDSDIEYDRHYIPLPGGWEVQTKGAGSTFRVLNRKTGERLAIPDSPYLHETLEQMAREINAACTRRPAMADHIEVLRQLLREAVPYLRDAGEPFEDDGGNEPLELSRRIEDALESDAALAAMSAQPEPQAAEIEALRAEVERLRGLVVSRFDQDGPPTFRQGTPENELEDPVTAEHCAWFVAEIKRLRAEVERLHEQLRLATVDQAIAEAEASDAHAENKRLQEAFVAQQPAIGEEIMVNAAHDVFILPLQPSGLNGPRFVVHVPGPERPAALATQHQEPKEPTT